MERLAVDGRFFSAGSKRISLRCVSYGPFPTSHLRKFSHEKELKRISAGGFHAIRIYEYPPEDFLDLAEAAGLYVWVTLPWAWGGDFRNDPSRLAEAHVRIGAFLRANGHHPALAGMFVANEIPADLVRLLGPTWVKTQLEQLISYARSKAPQLLYAYANYPTTEYLEPNNADFTSFNIYLENEDNFRSYISRLHHIASDRPIFISEFGLDTQRSSEEQQSAVLTWAYLASEELGVAGFTLYSWSDAWQNGHIEVDDWDFGLTKRDGSAKQSLTKISELLARPSNISIPQTTHRFSIIVCTFNGADRIATCIRALQKIDYPDYEIIIVNDGSQDSTEQIINSFSGIRVIHQKNLGLSAARNAGAAIATGEVIAFTDDDCEADNQWLYWLNQAYQHPAIKACGGPNIPPAAQDLCEAVVAATSGGPSHVLVNDTEAEHIPGCNLSVKKDVFEKIGGFDHRFRIAGDDVDFCWRLENEQFKIGFAPCAFVWHRRRTSMLAFWRQQREYGKAEAMLYKKHPERFNDAGSIRWSGAVYTGASIAVTSKNNVAFGRQGENTYQSAIRSHQALRPLQLKYQSVIGNTLLQLVSFFQPIARWVGRRRNGLKTALHWPQENRSNPSENLDIKTYILEKSGLERKQLLAQLEQKGWQPVDTQHEWDLQKGKQLISIAMEQHQGTESIVLVKSNALLSSSLFS